MQLARLPGLRRRALVQAVSLVLALTPMAAPMAAVAVAAARPAETRVVLGKMGQIAGRLAPERPVHARAETRLVFAGLDIDGDGAPDFANPTGKAPRAWDAFGSGAFGARRDGGHRYHEGVDYAGIAGQEVTAPISGFVSKIGFAYAGDASLRFVEITNPALGYVARAFYVDPTIEVGAAVRIGQPIGRLRTLQDHYPGITDHVHLELMKTDGVRIDAAELIHARRVTVRG
ncbi:M23 family metallopeptidase [Phenylobacterium sp.]|uniref:M23 family metallopeptidase n=1 Tax=Phenylobacterium sp. TaxID=1871053 RepID=UPI00391BE667